MYQKWLGYTGMYDGYLILSRLNSHKRRQKHKEAVSQERETINKNRFLAGAMCALGLSKIWKTQIYLKDFDLFYEEVYDATPPSHSNSPNTWNELGPYAPHVSESKKANISKI